MSNQQFLLETIKIINGIPQHLEFHNQRLNYTRQHFNSQSNTIDLKQFIVAPSTNGIYKCRVIYSNTIEDIQYSSYTDRQFKTFQTVIANDINYQFKYLNRDALNQLQAGARGADDILIIKNGFITDTSIANLAFYDDKKWITPTTPLLEGTTRARLLKQKKIIAAPIRLENIKKYSKMALMNALLGFYIIKQPIINKTG
ncbi:aminotransferase class IV [Candidatus Marithrix sp. Canyon 246]|uniref:aminotransferase class IV n=1 Tax=Candidatus Marithrix sp. Canyon 246 TaxID=1827136 RepID=UPI000849FA5D|nr:aminotransferase class IV [Candidatus Marithrix sp. Canyon 246]